MSIKLNLHELKVLQRLVTDKRESLKANKTLMRLADNGIGKQSGKDIVYDESDFDAIHDLIKFNQRADDFITPSSLANLDNRLEVGKYNSDEKLTKTQVFGRQILVVGLNTPIPLQVNGQTYEMPQTPKGVLPTIGEGYLDISRIKKIIIIENGQLLTHWWEWSHLLPADWQESVLVFRGFNDNVRMVNDIVKNLSNSCQVGLFFDYDLAGVHLMQGYIKANKHQYFALIPLALEASLTFEVDNQASIYNFFYYNQKEKFIEQSLKYTSAGLTKSLKAIFASIFNHRLALMQEHLVRDNSINWTMVKLS